MNRAQRDIKHYHTFLPKEERPLQGKRYILSMNDKPVYMADITDFKGGCWATVQVVESSEEHKELYTPGMSFDIKVAFYGFQEVKEEVSTDETAAAREQSNAAATA